MATVSRHFWRHASRPIATLRKDQWVVISNSKSSGSHLLIFFETVSISVFICKSILCMKNKTRCLYNRFERDIQRMPLHHSFMTYVIVNNQNAE